MSCASRAILLSLLSILPCGRPELQANEKSIAERRPRRSRTFRLDYGATLTRLPKGVRVRVWIPVPQTTTEQTIKPLGTDLPAKGSVATESAYGNRVLYFEAPGPEDGHVSFRSSWQVTRYEVRGLNDAGRRVSLTARQRKQFLSANSLVPISGRPLELLRNLDIPENPLALGRSLYDRVDEHVRYDKSKPGYGNGDVRWVCDSRFGNCTDFHSLFISLARSKGLPARFEIGLPRPPRRGQGEIGGYHCWALFHTETHGWVPVDISEADKNPALKDYYFGNLTEDRVTFSIGRDINLVPRQSGPPLNYFVYPYVEVDGKPWPKARIRLSLKYRDVEPVASE